MWASSGITGSPDREAPSTLRRMIAGAHPASLLAAVTLALLLVLAGCGASEGTFTAEQFVAEANARGAGLVLGPPLETDRAETTIYELSLEESDNGAAGGETHGGGSLTVLPDAEAGLAEYERCETSASLICFRAANVAVIFDGNIAPDEISRLKQALRAMASS